MIFAIILITGLILLFSDSSHDSDYYELKHEKKMDRVELNYPENDSLGG